MGRILDANDGHHQIHKVTVVNRGFTINYPLVPVKKVSRITNCEYHANVLIDLFFSELQSGWPVNIKHCGVNHQKLTQGQL